MKKTRQTISNQEEWRLSNRLSTIVKNCNSDVTITIRGTGSKGNSTVIKDNHTGKSIIIDAGVTCRKKSDILGVFITHAHLDHVSKLSSYDAPIYIALHESISPIIERQYDLIRKIPNFHYIEHRVTYTLDTFEVTPLYAEHDTKNPMHFFIKVGDISIFYGCDAVNLPMDYEMYFNDADVIMLDCNYDSVLMETDEIADDIYSLDLKDRIIQKGHCSTQYIKKRMYYYEEKLVPMHLSHNYNSVDRVRKVLPNAITIAEESLCPLYIRIYNGCESYREYETPSILEVYERIKNGKKNDKGRK